MPEEVSWASPCAVTEVGRAGPLVDQLGSDVATIRRTSCNLVFHYRAGGDFAENGIAAERIAEIDTRYADAMFDRLRELGGESLSGQRHPAQRLVGCCRDFTVLFVAMARHKGIPARARVGFASYFIEGWFIDHVIAEVWDGTGQQWRLVEPEISDEYARQVGFDAMDVPTEAFLTGGDAWLRARAGDADPERFVVTPELDAPNTRGWHYLRHNLIHDLASLNKQEMVLWDIWGLMDTPKAPDTPESELLDDLARLTASENPSVDALASWARADGLAVPPTVTSYDPMTGVPRGVDVSRIVRQGGLAAT